MFDSKVSIIKTGFQKKTLILNTNSQVGIFDVNQPQHFHLKEQILGHRNQS